MRRVKDLVSADTKNGRGKNGAKTPENEAKMEKFVRFLTKNAIILQESFAFISPSKFCKLQTLKIICSFSKENKQPTQDPFQFFARTFAPVFA